MDLDNEDEEEQAKESPGPINTTGTHASNIIREYSIYCHMSWNEVTNGLSTSSVPTATH